MKAMDEKTRLAIDKIVAKTVQQVGFKQPPILIDPILHELEVNRNFVNLPAFPFGILGEKNS